MKEASLFVLFVTLRSPTHNVFFCHALGIGKKFSLSCVVLSRFHNVLTYSEKVIEYWILNFFSEILFKSKLKTKGEYKHTLVLLEIPR